ncbi:histidine kinase [Marinobacterium zhoushanense]|uniref:diguanylate cyclase n=1 Tax=Marinobacterium zhoushanense TaxID=1679163 RepID=A0ABQ1KMD6_9GAMM|nr:sensor domain-containing diguanylate cyclase [Marinobacterium zhoushanense]GGC01514.1 histidine kinase [Marinobacterium zhoushanense]
MAVENMKPDPTYQHGSVEEADKTLNIILDVIVEGTWDWNGQTGEVLRSPGWYRMLGYEVGAFKKDVFTWENVIHPDDYERVMENFELYITGKIDTYCIDYRCLKADGDYLWITDRARVVEQNPDGTVSRMIGAHHNIHDTRVAQIELIKKNELLEEGNLTLEKIISKKAEELEKRNIELNEKIAEIESISNTDALTGIANRNKFEVELSKEISRSERYGHPLSLAIFDVDYFKHINDTYGHRTGDEVLKKLADFVRHNIRDMDIFARWGGEEFVIIFPSIHLEDAVHATEKLRAQISQYEIKTGLFITCSFGVTECGKGESVEALFTRIDNALYVAKKSGRNRVERLVNDQIIS